jgi:hypothetical protein
MVGTNLNLSDHLGQTRFTNLIYPKMGSALVKKTLDEGVTQGLTYSTDKRVVYGN